MKKIGKIIVVVGIIMLVLITSIATYMAKGMVQPNVMTLQEEKQWEIEHGMWGNIDSYEKESYQVKGVGDYKLNVMHIKAPNTNNSKFVIISHGYRSNRHGSVKYVDVYRNMGYDTIIYDVRGHGENQPTTVTLGNIESQDLLYLIEDTYARFGEGIHLGLHGESMGSSISLSVLNDNPKVDFVVADAGFTNLYDLIHTGYKANSLGFMMPFFSGAANIFWGVNLRETNAIEAVKVSQVPITFIHGANDTFILPMNSEQLAAAHSGWHDVHIIPNAAHAESREVLGVEAYQQLIKANPGVLSE